MFKRYSKIYLAEFVYGATDGTVTTFAIISGVMGAALSPVIVLLLGISNVLADGFSMASSNYLSSKSEQSVHSQGHHKNALKTALVTFLAFVLVGSIPLIPFVYALFLPLSVEAQFPLSIAFTAIAFVSIGAIRGIVSGTGSIRSAVETLIIGGIAAGIAFSVGYLLSSLIPV